MDSALDDPQDLLNNSAPSNDSEFGSWMIISRWHGRAWSRGRGSRLGSASIGAAVKENSAHALPHSVPSRGT